MYSLADIYPKMQQSHKKKKDEYSGGSEKLHILISFNSNSNAMRLFEPRNAQKPWQVKRRELRCHVGIMTILEEVECHFFQYKSISRRKGTYKMETPALDFVESLPGHLHVISYKC